MSLQPREFALVENQIVAGGLRVVIAVVAQGIADDVETVGGNQRRAGRFGPALQIIGRENLA